MTVADLQALLPLLAIAVTVIALLLFASFRQSHAAAVLFAAGGNAAAFLMLPLVAANAPRHIGILLVNDPLSLFFQGLIFIGSFCVALFSRDYLARFTLKREEFYILLLLATLGAAVLAASAHFATLFFGLELLTVSLYVLIGYVFRKEHSLEAAIKYLILAAASSAFLLFGMALIYAETGAMDFEGILSRLRENPDARTPLILGGVALMMTGIGFKLAVAPFHIWTPDIYQGAPAPVTAFLATVSKGAVVAVLLRLFAMAEGPLSAPMLKAFYVIAILSMVIGNLLALLQSNVKRILAYSSIAHFGYLLVALLAGGAAGLKSASFYFATYFVTTLGAFGVISHLATGEGEREDVAQWRGLHSRCPTLACMFTLQLLSLIGIPLTAGFLGKFLVLSAGVGADLWLPVFVLAGASAVGLYYYLKILLALYANEDIGGSGHPVPAAPITWTVLLLLTLAILWLGIYPAPLLDFIGQIAAASY